MIYRTSANIKSLVKTLRISFTAVCILFIPLFECICCEIEFETPHTCCDSELPHNQGDSSHPCLDSFQAFSAKDGFQLNSLALTKCETVFLASNSAPSKFPHKLRAYSSTTPTLRRHLLFSSLVI